MNDDKMSREKADQIWMDVRSLTNHWIDNDRSQKNWNRLCKELIESSEGIQFIHIGAAEAGRFINALENVKRMVNGDYYG